MPLVNVKFFEDAVERTEEEIAELRAAGLIRDEPVKPAAPAPAKAPTPAAPAPANTKE